MFFRGLESALTAATLFDPYARPDGRAGNPGQILKKDKAVMPSDRHIELQNMVYRWIDNRSIKMCGLPECDAVGYIADFVAIARMNDDLHSKYCRFSGVEKKTMRRVWVGRNLPLETIIEGDVDRHYVCVFEVKVSRADFLNTFGGKKTEHAKARTEPVGTAHWVVADKGVCKPEELPDMWGLIIPYGTGLSERKPPKLNLLPEEAVHSIAFDMLWQQMNYRVSYYDQLKNMSETIKLVHEAAVKGRPMAEVLRRSNHAITACRGFI